MALSDQERSIRRLHKLKAKQKLIDREIEGLNVFFRTESLGKDVIFKSSVGLEVLVTNGSKQLWDGDLLSKHFGDKASMYKKTSTYQTVSCREMKV